MQNTTNISICSLSSGSSGNSILIRTKNTAILVDCGLTGKAVEQELEKAGQNPSDISAIIVTHEHIDHIKGVGIFSRRYKTPVYATLGTWGAMIDQIGKIDPELIHYIASDIPFNIDDCRIYPFATSHDAAESIGLIFSGGGKCGAVATDLGTVTKHIYSLLEPCDILFIEANHDVEMLKRGPYPQALKLRILSDCGHLSNTMCGALCAKLVRDGRLKQITLGHLSTDNNTVQCAYQCVKQSIELTGYKVNSDVTLCVANRSSISDMMVI